MVLLPGAFSSLGRDRSAELAQGSLGTHKALGSGVISVGRDSQPLGSWGFFCRNWRLEVVGGGGELSVS